MAADLKPGDTIEAFIPEWMAVADNLPRDKYGVPICRIMGKVNHIAAKSIYVDVTEPVKKRMFLALSLLQSGKITMSILNVADPEAEPEEFSGKVAENPYPNGRIYLGNGGKNILVETPYDQNLIDRARQVLGGTWDHEARARRYPPNPITALALYDAFEGTQVHMLDLGFQVLIAEGRRLDSVSTLKTASEDELAQPAGLKTRLWLHQLRALHFASELPGAALFMAMGTGKTLTTIAYIVHNKIKTTLVVAPRSVVGVWPKDVRKHAGDSIRVCALDKGSVVKKVELAKAALAESAADGKPLIIVINYESAWRTPFGVEITEGNRVKETGFIFSKDVNLDLLVLDESHKIKNAQGRAAKFCHRLAAKVPRKLILTGTPMPHDPLDIFSQYLVLDGGATFGKSYTQFRSKYARMGGYGGYQVMGYQNVDELQRLMYRVAFRVTEDVVELPERVFIERRGELTPKERAAYRAMANDLAVSLGRGTLVKETFDNAHLAAMMNAETGALDDAAIAQVNEQIVAASEESVITAQNVLVQLLRLAQLSSGFIMDENGVIAEYGQSKLDLLMDVLEDIDKDEPFVVFVRFRHDIERIRAALSDPKLPNGGYKVAELSGKRNQLAEWQDGHYQALVVQLQSGGVGVDFTRSGDKPCKYCIYYGKDYNWGNYVQSLKRIHRPGQTETVRFISLVMEETIDEVVERVLDNRGNLVESVLAAKSLNPEGDAIKPEDGPMDLMQDALNDALAIFGM